MTRDVGGMSMVVEFSGSFYYSPRCILKQKSDRDKRYK